MRKWWLLVGSLLVVAGLSAWVWQVAWLKPDERNAATAYGQFVLAAAGVLIIVAGPVVRAFKSRAAPMLDQQADLLAVVVHDQWQKAAADRRLREPAPLPIHWRRSTLPVAGPVAAATEVRCGQTRFDPLPGLHRITLEHVRDGDGMKLHAVYGGLASGRLIIIGAAGSGKSAAAILLLLDALQFRDQASTEDRRRIPVPVMFTLHGWHPDRVEIRDWIAHKLTELPLFKGDDGKARATSLLDAGRIAVFLDGLDEIEHDRRSVALQALSDQVMFRLVLLTRSDELVEAVGPTVLVGAIALELQPISAPEAADYLLRPLVSPPPEGWQAVADELTWNPTGPLAQALDSPLVITLIRDAYQSSGAVNELLDRDRFPSSDDIENHLLDHALITAYKRRPGSRRPLYSSKTAQKTLRYIAWNLAGDGTRDLAWWDIPRWTPRATQVLTCALVAGMVSGTTAVLSQEFVGLPTMEHPGYNGILGAVFGAWSALARVERLGSRSNDPRRSWWKSLVAIITIVLSAVPVLVMIDWLSPFSSIGPADSFAISLSYAVGVVSAWPPLISQIYLFVRHGVPLRMMRFSEDARSRHLVRTIGPVYQFRHAKLQDRLARQHVVSTVPPPGDDVILGSGWWYRVSPWTFGVWQFFVLSGLWGTAINARATPESFSEIELTVTAWIFILLTLSNTQRAWSHYRKRRPIRSWRRNELRVYFYILCMPVNILIVAAFVADHYEMLI